MPSVTQANCKKSLVDGTAFLDVAVDLSAYASLDTATFHPYYIELTDSASKVAWGYIGASGSGEALGSELVTNGNMETADPPSGWLPGANTTLDGVADERTGGAGAQSLEVEVTSGTGDAHQEIVTIAGAIYKLPFWAKNIDAASLSVQAFDDAAYTIKLLESDSLVGYVAWAQCTGYFSAVSIQARVRMRVSGTNVTARFDDVSCKQLTDCSTNGVHILSTIEGSTRNWADIESGFNYNDSSGYTYEIKLSLDSGGLGHFGVDLTFT